MTTKPSERIVVFVTPAQKLAISNTAASLGISASELMRRAVMSFDVTSEQVKVAGIVDRLRAPRAPDPLNVALRQVAERAAAREARDAAQVAKTASKRTALAEEVAAETEALPPADEPPIPPAIPTVPTVPTIPPPIWNTLRTHRRKTRSTRGMRPSPRRAPPPRPPPPMQAHWRKRPRPCR
jgi:hypothetical protein